MAATALTPSAENPLLIDRYAIYDAIAAGGMATVHLGRLVGPAGFLRTVAVKRLHAQYANDAEFTGMLLDEARVAARIQHPNVVSTLDVVVSGTEILLVMDYVRGESLARLCRRARDLEQRPPPRIVVSVMQGALEGLHAAHEAKNERGQPLGLIHRDVSPQNILVGSDGVARVLDFGIAKAEGRVSTTQDGKIKGKILYMSPEQLAADHLTRSADIYAAGVVLFEALTNVRMFAGENEGAALSKILRGEIRVPSEVDPSLAKFDEIVRRSTQLKAEDRYQTAAEMAEALLEAESPATASQVAAWVYQLVGDVLEERARVVADIERSSTRSKPPIAPPTSGAVRIDPQPPPPSVGSLEASPPSTGSHSSPNTGGHAFAAADASASHFLRAPPQPQVNMTVVAVGALVLAFLGAVLVIGAIAFRSSKDGAPAAAASDRAAVPAIHVGAAVDSAASTASNAAVSAASVASAAATAVGTAGATAGATAATTTATASSTATGAPPKAVVARPALNCDPPYTIDKAGRKHFIPECVR